MFSKEKKEHEHKDGEKEAAVGKSHKDAKEPVTVPHEELEALKAQAQKAQENWDRFLRQQADFENLRKRLERDRQDFVKFANEELICDLLNVLDDLERTVELAQEKHEDLSAFLKGVEMILAHLYELLKKYGVKPIEAKGKIFDPHFHEALMQAVEPSVPEHTILEEMQRGYLLHDRVIRTTKVKVSKKGEDEKEGAGPSA
jgi:molecular chaperone GrpE